MRALIALLAAVVLSACAPTSTTTINGVTVDPSISDAGRGAAALPATEAARLFDTVCGGTLPNFAGAQRRMASAGFTINASTGTRYHGAYDASMRILDGPGFGQTCSMVFVSGGSTNSVYQALQAGLGPMTDSPIGRAIAYRNGRTIILLAEPRRLNGQTYYNLRMWSER